VDSIAIKQQLLAQYDMLQSRIKDLKDSAENEVLRIKKMYQSLVELLYSVNEQPTFFNFLHLMETQSMS